MTVDFTRFSPNTFQGNPISQPISIGASGGGPPRPPQIVRMTIDWNAYGASSANQQVGVSANLFAQAQTTSPLDLIRSVFIDNTYVPVPVYVQFPDSLATYLCPAFAQAMHPVYTFQQTFTIFGDGFQDGDVAQTNLFFSNIDRQGYYVPAVAGGQNGAPTVPVILIKTTDLTVNTTGNMNFPDVPFGDPDEGRVIALSIATARSSSGTIEIATVTIGGIAATMHAKGSSGSGVTLNSSAEIWSAVVPTGTSGPIVITTSVGGTLFFRASVYSIRNLQSPTPVDAQQRSNANTVYTIAGVQTGTNGVLLACAGYVNSGAAGFGWQNVQQNMVLLQTTNGTTNYFGSAASLLTSQNGNVNVGVTCRPLAAVSWV